MLNPNATVSKRAIGSSGRVEYLLSLGGVDIRVQLHPFSQDEINFAVREYLATGQTHLHHKPTYWGERYASPRQKLAGGGELMEPIVYDGNYLED